MQVQARAPTQRCGSRETRSWRANCTRSSHEAPENNAPRSDRANRIPALLDRYLWQSGIFNANEKGLRILPRGCRQKAEGTQRPREVLPGTQNTGRLGGKKIDPL